jgi:hypothetical protein
MSLVGIETMKINVEKIVNTNGVLECYQKKL